MPTIYLRNRTREQIALPAVPPFIMGDLNNPSTSLADVMYLAPILNNKKFDETILNAHTAENRARVIVYRGSVYSG